MSDSVDEIVKELVKGTLSPEQAVAAYDLPAKHLSQVPIDNLKVDVIRSGFPTLDDFLFLKRNRSELIIVGARPSMGKSAFVFQMASYVAKAENVLIYSLEMDAESIIGRMLAAESGRSLSHIQKGLVPASLLSRAHLEVSKLHFYVDDRGGLDVKTIRSSANTFHKKNPVGLVVVDYLQMVKSRDRNSRTEEITEISAELKMLAKDLKCPVVAAAQLNRECEKRGKLTNDYRPVLSDLKEGGSIEQDADVVLFLSRQEAYDGTRPGEADVGIAKNRNGNTGWIPFKFLGASTRFKDEGRGNDL